MEILYMIVLLVIGIIMAVAPQKLANKSVLDNPSRLMLVRIMGAIAAVGSIFVLVIMIFA